MSRRLGATRTARDPTGRKEASTMAMNHHSDMVDVLLMQHDRIVCALDQVEANTGETRATALRSLVRLVDQHDAVEADVVHPLTIRSVVDGDAIARTSATEEDRVKELLGRLGAMDVRSARFPDAFAFFRSMLARHLHREEAEEFMPLRAAVERRQLVDLVDAARIR
ncbi:MAG TPA: hemerythrin domain-containing protein [Micromonosporaceae bacterium]|nr:hemerythrin domain-containing protein [Micromonosporaceae bacterium]